MVARCRQGEQCAWETLYARLAGKLFPVCLRYADDYMQAQDLFQEAFLKLAKNIGQWKGSGSFEGWAYRVFVNECISHLRKRAREKFTYYYPETPSHDDEEASEDDFISSMNIYYQESDDHHCEAQLILHMVQALPVHYRTVFNLFAIEGYSHREIAQMLNIPENTSKVYLHRARKILRQMLERYLMGKPSPVKNNP